MGEREKVEALAKVPGAHIAEAGGWHCSCQPIDESDGTRLLLDDTWDAHAAQAVLDSPAMRDLLAEAKADAWDEAWIAHDDAAYVGNPYRSNRREGCGSCLTCDPPQRSEWTGLPMMRMYVCATCGNKRCPAAGDCLKWECSGSNDTGQTRIARDAT